MDVLNRLRAAKTLGDIFQALIPGMSDAAKRLRRQAIALSEDMLAHGALIIGPPGSGKTTLARAIALGRYAHLLKTSYLPTFLKSMALDAPARLATTNMDWYRETSLTGLVETLADAQLFGIGKSVATGVAPREGIFRLAMHGLPPSEIQRPTMAAAATGGVVFLDEIGDLPPTLQPKLLTVLTGAQVFPVGYEGDPKRGYAFNGLTIAATWRHIGRLRPDLRARLSDHVIRVPSLGERLDDLAEIAAVMVAEMRRALSGRLTELRGVPSDGGVDKIDRQRFADVPEFALTNDDLAALRAVDWDSYGDVRGLNQVLRTAFGQKMSVTAAIERQAPDAELATHEETPQGSGLLDRILNGPAGGTLVASVGDAEMELRREFAERLKSDVSALSRVAAHLGCEPSQLRRSLLDLVRDRSTRRGTSAGG